jgi:serine/threonine protein phosphatase 1
VKRLIIGDIHGCYDELRDLLDKSGIGAEDEILALGDIVDRGPCSPEVLQFFRSRSTARSVMGNHERKHVRSCRGQTRPALSQIVTRHQIGEADYPDAVMFMDSLPRFLELPEAILVHGMFEPGIPLAQQKETVLVGTLSGEAYLAKKYQAPWYELYHGSKPLIFGHHDYLGNGMPLVRDGQLYGIDTACCHGKALTGLVLPEFRLIGVRSRKDYWQEIQETYYDLRYKSASNEDLTWEAAESFLRSAQQRSQLSPAAQERVAHLRSMLDEVERRLQELFGELVRKNAEVLEELRAKYAFDAQSPQKQGSLYAACIGKTRWASFLHRLRKGQLQLSDLRAHFEKPSDVLKSAGDNPEEDRHESEVAGKSSPLRPSQGLVHK